MQISFALWRKPKNTHFARLCLNNIKDGKLPRVLVIKNWLL